MRVVISIFAGAIFTLAAGAGPSLAKNSEAPNGDGGLSSPPCHAYEQNPDGSWKQLSCDEPGLKPEPAPKVSTRGRQNARHRQGDALTGQVY